MAQIQRTVKIASNPQRSGKSSRPNAAKKGSHMKKNSKKAAALQLRRQSNPIGAHKKKAHRNPGGFREIMGDPKDVLVTGIAGLASAVATRQLPQLVLAAGNTGVEGYFANFVTALLSTWAAGAFMGPKAAWGALTGGMVILLDRVLTEQVSPLGPYLTLSGVGDATAMTKMGTIREGWYTHPGLVDGNGTLIAPDPYTQQAMAAMLAKYPQLAAPLAQAMATGGGKTAPATMGAVNPSALRRHVASGQLMSSRFQSRFNSAQN